MTLINIADDSIERLVGGELWFMGYPTILGVLHPYDLEPILGQLIYLMTSRKKSRLPYWS